MPGSVRGPPTASASVRLVGFGGSALRPSRANGEEAAVAGVIFILVNVIFFFLSVPQQGNVARTTSRPGRFLRWKAATWRGRVRRESQSGNVRAPVEVTESFFCGGQASRSSASTGWAHAERRKDVRERDRDRDRGGSTREIRRR
jgi:hypothetical protein